MTTYTVQHMGGYDYRIFADGQPYYDATGVQPRYSDRANAEDACAELQRRSNAAADRRSSEVRLAKEMDGLAVSRWSNDGAYLAIVAQGMGCDVVSSWTDPNGKGLVQYLIRVPAGTATPEQFTRLDPAVDAHRELYSDRVLAAA